MVATFTPAARRRQHRDQMPGPHLRTDRRFYRDTLALPLIEEEADGCISSLGRIGLVDLVPNLESA